VSAAHPPASLVPYVAPTERSAELTVRAVVLGALLSLTFGMVNSYLALKIGLTVSASIPSAVLSMAILRGILRRARFSRTTSCTRSRRLANR
jgi:uncharacterized oligopeptide transporter (OPT) family protein